MAARSGGALGLRTGATYTWHDIRTDRTVSFQSFGDRLGADYHAGTTQAFGDLGYRIDAGPVALEPFGNLAYVNLHTDGFLERGGPAALVGRGSTTEATFTTLGLRASTSLDLGGTSVMLRGSIGWRHLFGEDVPVSTMNFVGGSPFNIAGVPIARDAAAIDAGLDFRISSNAVLGIAYGGQFSAHALDQTVRGTFSLKF